MIVRTLNSINERIFTNSSKISDERSSQLVSVVIRTRNRHESLCQAIASVITQKWDPIEIIIVNDGGYSVSGYVQNYLQQQMDIKMALLSNNKEENKKYYLLHRAVNCLDCSIKSDRKSIIFINIIEGGNRSRAANIGWKNAKGSLLLFLDDDDLLMKHHISGLMRAIERNPWSSVVFSGHVVKKDRENNICCSMKDFSLYALAKENLFPLHCALVRKVALEAVQGFDENMELFEDWDLWLSIALKGFGFTPVQQWSAIYRIHNSSTISNNPFGSDKDIEGRYRVMLKHETDIQKKLLSNKRKSGLTLMLRIILFKIAKNIL
ncbi:MAG: glycosyltransferase family 2 protein [Desulfamplus sp.]|nr:glycosyltransferase family 2 protein [Desulfamplus sp.]